MAKDPIDGTIVPVDEEAARAESEFQQARNSQIFKQWYDWEVDEFLRGNHYTSYSYSAANATLIAIPTPIISDNLKTKLVLNKVLAAHKALKGFITRGDRGIVVNPIDIEGSDSAQELSQDLSAFAYYLYRELKLKKIEKTVVDFGLRRSFGVVKIYWDDDYHNGEGFPCVDIYDTFDFYYDPTATSEKNANYIVVTSKQTLRQIWDNPNYSDEKYKVTEGDGEVAASYIRTQELILSYPTIGQSPADPDLQTCIVKEKWFKKKNGKKTEVWRMVFVKDHILVPPEKTEFDDYPFVIYHLDNHPNELIGEGALKHLIPINRAIDRIQSQKADYNNIFMKGSYKMDKGAGLKIINNKNGKIFQVNKGFSFEQLPMLALPPTVTEQENQLNQYFDIISGMTEAMMGEKPPATRSGKELEDLQEAGANNIIEFKENLDIFLEEVYMQLFKLFARHYKSPKKHPVGNFFNNLTVKSFVGEKYGDKNPGAVIIPDNIHIAVSPDNLIGYTQSARFDRVMQLEQQGIFDQQAVLELLAINGYQDIIKRMEQRRQQEMAQQQQQQQQQAVIQQQVRSMPIAPKVNLNLKGELTPVQSGEVLETQGINPNPGTPPDVLDALKEDQLMEAGQYVPPTVNPSPQHTQAHIERLNHPNHKNLPLHVYQTKYNHIRPEAELHDRNRMASALPFTPQPIAKTAKPT